MKLYIVKGYRIKKKNIDLYKRVDSFVGYFSNLKEIYSKFDSKTVSSYSTVAKTMNAEGIFQVFNSKFNVNEKSKEYLEITIYRIETNSIYSNSQFINFQKYIKDEVNEFNYGRKNKM